MPSVFARLWLLVAVLSSLAATAASAQVPVVFGTSWDGVANRLQAVVDARYGPGAIDVANDYIGHDAGDPDPFAWTDQRFDALLVREIAGNAHRNVVGWYK